MILIFELDQILSDLLQVWPEHHKPKSTGAGGFSHPQRTPCTDRSFIGHELPFECDGDDHELGAGEADPLAGVEEVRVQQHLDPEGDER